MPRHPSQQWPPLATRRVPAPLRAGCLPSRSGPPGSRRAYFIALDHGVGIPASAPFKNRDLKAYLAKVHVNEDHKVLWHMVTEEGRSRTGLPQHGKGLPAMLSLVKDRSYSGALWIFSGRALYFLTKDPRRSKNRRLVEAYYPLAYKVPGTLIVWKVDLPNSPSVLPGLTA